MHDQRLVPGGPSRGATSRIPALPAWNDSLLTHEQTLIQIADTGQSPVYPAQNTPLPSASIAQPPARASLQKLWLKAMPRSGSHAVTAGGFKIILQSTLDFLTVHQLPATLWVKLPRGESWWCSLQQYAQARPASRIYSLGDYRPEPALLNWQTLPLWRRYPLKGEYLLAILAPSFSCTILAVRQRDSQPTPSHSRANQPTSKKLAVRSAMGTRVLRALQPTLRSLVKAAIPKEPAAEKVLDGWSLAFPLDATTDTISPLNDAFFQWQLQVQTRLYQKLSDYPHQPAPISQEPTVHGTVVTTDFLQAVSQELLNPLTRIKTALTLLNSPSIKADQRHRYLSMVSRECDRQAALVQKSFELLTLQLMSQPNVLKPISLIELVPGIVSTYQPLAYEQNILLSNHIPANLPAVAGQESWIKQALIELLSNSLQFTDKHGQIGVSAYQHSEQLVALTIQDTGRGIADQEISKIADPFFRGSAAIINEVQGPGLGLTLAKKLIELCGGQLRIDNTLRAGTTLTMLLPTYATNGA